MNLDETIIRTGCRSTYGDKAQSTVIYQKIKSFKSGAFNQINKMTENGITRVKYYAELLYTARVKLFGEPQGGKPKNIGNVKLTNSDVCTVTIFDAAYFLSGDIGSYIDEKHIKKNKTQDSGIAQVINTAVQLGIESELQKINEIAYSYGLTQIINGIVADEKGIASYFPTLSSFPQNIKLKNQYTHILNK